MMLFLACSFHARALTLWYSQVLVLLFWVDTLNWGLVHEDPGRIYPNGAIVVRAARGAVSAC